MGKICHNPQSESASQSMNRMADSIAPPWGGGDVV